MKKTKTKHAPLVSTKDIVKRFTIEGGWECGYDKQGNVRSYYDDTKSWWLAFTAAQLAAMAAGKIPKDLPKIVGDYEEHEVSFSGGMLRVGCKEIGRAEIAKIAKDAAAIEGKKLKVEPPGYYKEFTSECNNLLAIDRKGNVVIPGGEDIIVLTAATLDKMAAVVPLIQKAKAAFESMEKAVVEKLPEGSECGNYELNKAGESNGCIGDIVEAVNELGEAWDFAVGCNVVTIKEFLMVHALSRKARGRK